MKLVAVRRWQKILNSGFVAHQPSRPARRSRWETVLASGFVEEARALR